MKKFTYVEESSLKLESDAIAGWAASYNAATDTFWQKLKDVRN